MIKFKACPKCRGDIYVAQDMFGRYLNCLQCGYLKDIPEEPVARPRRTGGMVVEEVQEVERAAA
ncbi:MAG: hypothetical protein FJ316_07885 [SAR202 cluster bacterium]|nr:hypothetical protein [SAR202 cluster bacterium]